MGQVLSLDGLTGYASAPDSPALRTPSTQHTLAAWVWPDSTNTKDWGSIAIKTAGSYSMAQFSSFEGKFYAGIEDTVAPNLLTTNQASLETDTTGWVTFFGNTSLARSTAQFLIGTASLSLTAVAAGDMYAYTTNGVAGVPVVAGTVYTALASVRSNTTSRSVNVGIVWYDAAGVTLSTSLGSETADTSTGWTQGSCTAQAPATAARAAIQVRVTAAGAAGEVHYVDSISIASGSSTTWYPPGVSPSGIEINTGALAAYVDQWLFLVVTGNEAGQGSGTLRIRAWTAAGALVIDVQGASDYSAITYSTGGLLIGRYGAGGEWKGRVARLGVHNTVLTDAQINTWRTTGTPPITLSGGFWPLNGVATDLHQANPTTIQPGATFVSDPTTPWTAADPAAGKRVLSLDGNLAYASAPDSPSLRTPSAFLTLGAWVWADSTGTKDWGTIVGKDGPGPGDSYVLGQRAEAEGKFHGSCEDNTFPATPEVHTYADAAYVNQWVFLCFQANEAGMGSGTARLRVWTATGTLAHDSQGGGDFTALTYGINPLHFGRYGVGGEWKGRLARVGIHNTVMTDAQLATWRTTGTPPITMSGGFWPFSGVTTDLHQGNVTTLYSGAGYLTDATAPWTDADADAVASGAGTLPYYVVGADGTLKSAVEHVVKADGTLTGSIASPTLTSVTAGGSHTFTTVTGATSYEIQTDPA